MISFHTTCREIDELGKYEWSCVSNGQHATRANVELGTVRNQFRTRDSNLQTCRPNREHARVPKIREFQTKTSPKCQCWCFCGRVFGFHVIFKVIQTEYQIGDFFVELRLFSTIEHNRGSKVWILPWSMWCFGGPPNRVGAFPTSGLGPVHPRPLSTRSEVHPGAASLALERTSPGARGTPQPRGWAQC